MFMGDKGKWYTEESYEKKKIISISNAEIGEYWVEYQEGRFKAYASTINPETVY